MKFKFLKGTFASLALACCSLANAGLIIGADSVTAPNSNGSALAVNIINQNGLSQNYTSGVTDFDTFLSTATHNNSCGSNCWANVPNVIFPINLDFSLGGLFELESIGIWNYHGALGLNEFELFAADNSSFLGSTSLGTFNVGMESSSAVASGQSFSFASTNASFIRMKLNSNYGSTGQVAIGEVVFEKASSTDIPEPSTLAIFALGMIGLASRRFKKQS
ncbi:PEP-CTERM sorting domain-containing protein [Colwellia psychrerythraea]|uniref:Ice-binding protein C-terminal domain-containing protein n=1 Tax=Colwellia psychrerythraea (strain 34H / ATCC BAA-681) TaxID=167879 RepID=Q48A00_COLP3|nr:PEP-CTERM sorting domain-containing protein [Colwellia psychrerythraea]AAZ26600.1 hypothetical protein CPS_0356 [Colwellia psychrerythraea 34H]